MTTAADKIIELSIAHPLGPFYPENIFDILYWCKDYEQRNKFPATILNRFAIGFYQINQGIRWSDGGVNKYESFAAAVLHLAMLTVRMDLAIEQHMPINLNEFKETSIQESSLQILLSLSITQQHLFYGNPANKTKRSSRYDKDKLTWALGVAIYLLISCIPKEYRSECFEKASTLMTRELK